LRRVHQIILIGSTIIGSWIGMQVVHELGHVIAAWVTGAEVKRVVLTPTTLSRTDVVNNLHPLIVAWAGPIVGAALPVVLWVLAQLARLPGAFVFRFFAGFCLIANGLYIGLGSFGGVGDCGEMLRYGSPPWLLWLFGAVTAPIGLALWNRQGMHFGLGVGVAHGQVSRSVAYTTFAVCLVLLVVGFAVDGQ
jgi:peptidase M50B-like protein